VQRWITVVEQTPAEEYRSYVPDIPSPKRSAHEAARPILDLIRKLWTRFCWLRCALQLRQNSPVSPGDSGDGGWCDGSSLVDSRRCGASGNTEGQGGVVPSL